MDLLFSWRPMLLENYSKIPVSPLELLGFSLSLLMGDCSCVSS